MNNFKFVAVLDATDYLIKDFTGLALVHSFFLYNMIKQLSITQILHN